MFDHLDDQHLQLETSEVIQSAAATHYAFSGEEVSFASHVAEFKTKHSKIKAGTVSISFKTSDTIPLESLKDVINLAMEGGG